MFSWILRTLAFLSLCPLPLGLETCVTQVDDGSCAAEPSLVVSPPFAQAALWALDAIPEKCDNWTQVKSQCVFWARSDSWRYLWNNLRLALQHATPERRAELSAADLAQVEHIHELMAEPALSLKWNDTAPLAREFLQTLRPWLEHRWEGTPMQIPRGNTGVRFPRTTRDFLETPQGGDVSHSLTLSNGVRLPIPGLGTWNIYDKAVYNATVAAVEAGYRHIDTAQCYNNQYVIAEAIGNTTVPPEEISIVTKLSDYTAFRRVREVFMEQLKELRRDFVDVYMLHTPGYDKDAREAAWRTMEELYDEGRIRALGVSNFNLRQMKELYAFARVKPVYIQLRYTIYQPGFMHEAGAPDHTMEWLDEHNITLFAYSVARSDTAVDMHLPPMQDPHVQAVAARLNRTSWQVLHRWVLQLGGGVIPMSKSRERIKANKQLFDFVIPDHEMRLLNGLATLVLTTPKVYLLDWCEDVYGVKAFVA